MKLLWIPERSILGSYGFQIIRLGKLSFCHPVYKQTHESRRYLPYTELVTLSVSRDTFRKGRMLHQRRFLVHEPSVKAIRSPEEWPGMAWYMNWKRGVYLLRRMQPASLESFLLPMYVESVQ